MSVISLSSKTLKYLVKVKNSFVDIRSEIILKISFRFSGGIECSAAIGGLRGTSAWLPFPLFCLSSAKKFFCLNDRPFDSLLCKQCYQTDSFSRLQILAATADACQPCHGMPSHE